MSLISEERRKAGLSQAALGQRLGVSASAVAQWEASEDRGTAQLGTLSKALSAMGENLLVDAVSVEPLSPVRRSVRLDLPDRVHPKQAILDAAYGDRVAAIAGEAWNLCIGLSVEDLWLVADRVTVAASLHMWNRARAVRDSYEALQKTVLSGLFVPKLVTPTGQRVPVPTHLTPDTAFDWMALSIRNGVPWLDAYRMAGAVLVSQGYPWPMLVCTDAFRQAWSDAIMILTHLGDANLLAVLFGLVIGRTHG